MTQAELWNGKNKFSQCQVPKRESGQALITAALMMGTVFSIGGFVIDMGRIYISFQQLQASTDAAALAAGQAMGKAGATVTSTENAAALYSSGSDSTQTGVTNTGVNPAGVMTSVGITTTIGCLNGTGAPTTVANIPCYGAGSGNAVKVTQTGSVPMTFARLFGATSFPLSFTSVATLAGAASVPYNIAILIDSTASMKDTDSDSQCSSERITCALTGVKTLLGLLYPCAASNSTCSVNAGGVATDPVDAVSLFTFPPIEVGPTNELTKDTTCPSSNPQIEPYAYPSSTPSTTNYSTLTYQASKTSTQYTETYQITPFQENYRSSDTGSLVTTAGSVIAVGGGSCNGIQAPGGDGTYYAGAIYSAEAALLQQQAALLPAVSQNALIIISDGDASSCGSTSETGGCGGTSAGQMAVQSGTWNQATLVAGSSGTYPSYNDQCAQAVTAAQYGANLAAPQTIRVYTIAYGAESSGCSTDSPAITPCNTMKDMASSPAYFYSDYSQSGSGVDNSCAGTAAPTTNINQIFTLINASLTTSRLVPNNMWTYNTL